MTVADANDAPTVTSATASGAIVEDQSFGAPPQLINNGTSRGPITWAPDYT